MIRVERFGEFLVEKGAIRREVLSRLLSTQRMVREKIGTIAVREGLIDEDQLTEYLGEFLGMPLFKASVETIEKGITQIIPMKMALKANVLPVGWGPNGELLLACGGPLSKTMLQTISRLTKRQVRLMLTSPGRLKKIQNLFFSRDYDTSIQLTGRVDVEDSGFVIELFEKLMLRAINQGASDLHLEPERDSLVVRFRVDGMLVKTESLPFDLCARLVSRIKVVAGMDIAERRKPQDGAFYFMPQALNVAIDGVNVRVSTLPVMDGEKAVMRLLPPHDEVIRLEELGMHAAMLERFKYLLKTPHGIVLVTGPTGSGKSTTLYGALQMLRSETTNITTIEDPVELTVRGVNQTQVDRGEKLSFADALRAILRQDPDIIMVGEIRDTETLRIALRAAITGHLVLSTLHTNDAPSAFGRMIDMGAEPFLVAASVRAVLAQRLVRTVCPACGRERTVTDAELKMLGIDGDAFSVRQGTGCDDCHLGYRGRLGLYELLEVDERMKAQIMQSATTEVLRRTAVENRAFRTLRQDGIDKVRQKLTTPEEIMRVTLE
ncbi:ATPase, T2SS/T4P/T4SS family [uncultured Desulfosarcina sp.]|uniref:GspE/PulE family protein n=1 Tax=uncultured Desulfosarcina sp. TaxID=218289 RepID=UPI0029C96D7C|nr:ATPase, T2SS/T4P/T4SS family [uncultured Desulfosarcina sp.]